MSPSGHKADFFSKCARLLCECECVCVCVCVCVYTCTRMPDGCLFVVFSVILDLMFLDLGAEFTTHTRPRDMMGQ
jgi:hypothetical protein